VIVLFLGMLFCSTIGQFVILVIPVFGDVNEISTWCRFIKCPRIDISPRYDN